jgi:translation initiation factor 2 alpha subunit (eIF-2alpha)
MEYNEGDLILCTVDKVDNTICFVHLPDKRKGTIVSSEIAPGRIKFMRAYVVPNKKIVCKILRISGDNINLSLRRVNMKEKKQVMQEYKQQLANKAALKQILGEDYTKSRDDILIDYPDLLSFIQESRENPEILEKYIPPKHIEQIQKITQKKKKQVELKYNITIKCFEDDGVKKIKEIFNIDNPNLKATYISAGKLTLKLKAGDFKEGKHEFAKILEEIEKSAKEFNCEIDYKEEKQ